MTKSFSVALAALLLTIGSFGTAGPVVAATPDAVDDGPVVVQKNAPATTINVLSNDTVAVDAAITGATDPAHGAVVIAGNGRSLTYQPDASYTGTDTFTYTVTDQDTSSDTATVTIKVNAPPVAADDPPHPSCFAASEFGGSFPIPEDYGEFPVINAPCWPIANDTDSDGTILSWVVDTEPVHGALRWLPGLPGVFGYTPDPDFSTLSGDWVSDSFSYHVVDNNGASSNEATFRIWVAPINDPPTVTAGPFVTSAEDTPYSQPWATGITAGPNEPDQTVQFVRGQTTLLSNPPLQFTDPPTIGADGTLSYTPAPNSHGWVTVSFVAKDDGGTDNAAWHASPPPNDTSAPVIVDITVTSVNDSPVANDDNLTIDEDDPVPYYLFVAGNDTDADIGDHLTVTGATDGTKGTTTFEAGSGSVSYLANPNAFGADVYTYTVSDGHGGTATGTVHVTINGVNDPPVAVDDGPAVVGEDSGANPIDVLTNDSDPDLDALTISAKTDGSKGTVAITGGGTGLTYTPSPNANGSDSFTYTIDDGNGGTDTATVDVTITAVADPPDAVDDTPPTIAQDAGPVTVDVLANDTDADLDPLTITSTTAATKGTVAITAGATAVTYHPNPGANGADSFTYTISDGNGGTDTATVHLTIAPDVAPDAVDDGPAVVGEDSGANAIDVLGNDSDPDLDPLTITGTTDGAKGTVAITGGGTGLTYTPAADATGSDSFTYTIDDGHGLTDTATVQITITAVNDPPVGGEDSLTVTEDQPSAGSVPAPLANDTDVDLDTLTISGATNGAKGVVTVTGGGSGVSYKPNANAFGSDTFTYTVDDGHGGTDVATVTVTITAVNDRPNAVNDGVPTPIRIWLHAGAQSVKVLLNDTSLPDGPETLKITKVTQGHHGVVAITGGGTGLTYNPSGSTTGVDLFTYTISDGHGGTDTATVQVSTAKDGSLPKAAITGLTKTSITGSTKLRLTVTWTLTDSGSGLRSQLLQRRTDSGSWVTVTLASLSTRTAGFSMSRGHLYTFRIRGVDRSGNVGLFAIRGIRI